MGPSQSGPKVSNKPFYNGSINDLESLFVSSVHVFILKLTLTFFWDVSFFNTVKVESWKVGYNKGYLLENPFKEKSFLMQKKNEFDTKYKQMQICHGFLWYHRRPPTSRSIRFQDLFHSIWSYWHKVFSDFTTIKFWW